jgi:hypothetical protein
MEGIFDLTVNDQATDLPIAGPGTFICEVVADLDGMTALSASLRLAYGSGGTSIKAYLQTSLDQGTTWTDIWCKAFATASEHGEVNISGLTPKTTEIVPTDGALADDTVLDGILGDRLRLKVLVTGTYASSTVLSGRVAVR